MNFVYLAQEIYQGYDESNRRVENTIVFSNIDKIRANNYMINDNLLNQLKFFDKIICRHKDDSLAGFFSLEITKVRII